MCALRLTCAYNMVREKIDAKWDYGNTFLRVNVAWDKIQVNIKQQINEAKKWKIIIELSSNQVKQLSTIKQYSNG